MPPPTARPCTEASGDRPQVQELTPHVALPAHLARDERRWRAAELPQIAARREGGPASAQHHDADVGIGVRGTEHGVEIVAHRHAVGVQALGAIERDRRDGAPRGVAQRRVGLHAAHTTSPPIIVRRTRTSASSSGEARSGSGSTTTRSAGPPARSRPSAGARSESAARRREERERRFRAQPFAATQHGAGGGPSRPRRRQPDPRAQRTDGRVRAGRDRNARRDEAARPVEPAPCGGIGLGAVHVAAHARRTRGWWRPSAREPRSARPAVAGIPRRARGGAGRARAAPAAAPRMRRAPPPASFPRGSARPPARRARRGRSDAPAPPRSGHPGRTLLHHDLHRAGVRRTRRASARLPASAWRRRAARNVADAIASRSGAVDDHVRGVASVTVVMPSATSSLATSAARRRARREATGRRRG